MKILKDLENHLSEEPEVKERAAYAGFLNLLLFCGTVFVFGFISRHVDDTIPVVKRTVITEETVSQTLPEDLAALKTQLETEFAPVTDLTDFSVKVNGPILEVHFGIGDIFMAGSSDLAGKKEETLAGLARFILPKVQNYHIEMQGHTDDVPVVKNAWKFPTNWELSTARASRILRVFLKNGHIPSQLTVSGRSWYEPIAPNRDAAGNPLYDNQLKNRRLVLLIGKK